MEVERKRGGGGGKEATRCREQEMGKRMGV
jgi:hypothetical protein